MRIVFMGTPEFAVPTLAAIVAAGHQVVAVYTQPPRPAGRGMAERTSAVHRFAADAGLFVLTPSSLEGEQEQRNFTVHQADVGVVVAYGLLLPKAILAAPRQGCLNLHASALPRWRGAAPIQRAIMAGDRETAATVMRMDEGLDTGPVCLTRRVPVGPDMTAGELHDTLAAQGAELMVEALAALERRELRCVAQPGDGVTYAAKIGKAETRIDFAEPARAVHDHVRALSPSPGAWVEVPASAGAKPERIKILRTALAEGSGPAGTILREDLTIACGEGAVRILEVQRGGRRPMGTQAFLRGFPLRPGHPLGGRAR
jgi:methionyl-tRNA formyltransferase